MLLATVSTILVFAVLGVIIVNSPGWPAARQAFFDQDEFARSFPRIARAFVGNVQIFLVAEACILVFALVLAVMRLASGPVFAPFRLLSLGYTDFFRGVPGILIVYMLGFGLPSLELPGLPIDPWFWGGHARSFSCTPRTSRRSTAPGSIRSIPARRPRRARWG